MITKEIIKNSLDAKWRKRQMRIWLVITGVYIGVFLFSALIAAAKHGDLLLSLQITGIYAVIMLLVFAPFLIYNLWCYYSL